MADPRRQYSPLTKLGFGALTFNSALSIYNSWGDARSVAFVLSTDAALLLLFLCLRKLERARGGAIRNRYVKAAVWVLTALLTAGSALANSAALIVLFVCLHDLERARAGDDAARIDMGGAYSALAALGLAAVNCNTALDAYNAQLGTASGSAALVFVSFALFVILTGLFIRAFSRAHKP